MLAKCFPTQAYPLPPQMVGISDLWLRTVLEYDLQAILHSKKKIIIIIKGKKDLITLSKPVNSKL